MKLATIQSETNSMLKVSFWSAALLDTRLTPIRGILCDIDEY